MARAYGLRNNKLSGKKSSNLSFIMLRNYFKIAFRNLLRKRAFAVLNISGLAIGICSCLILFHYVSYEKSYDAFHTNADQIVRLRMDFHDQGKLTMQSATVFPGIAPLMKKEYPEVKDYCRLVDCRVAWSNLEPSQYNLVISNDQHHIKALENKGFYADPSFLTMFTVPFIKGDPLSALNEPNSMIISENMAEKYFGKEEAIGKILTIREAGHMFSYEVKGVFTNYPANSHLAFNYLISYKTFDNLIHFLGKGKELNPETNLDWYDFYDYLLLRPGTDWKKLQADLPAFCDRHMNDPGGIARNSREDLYLMPLRDIYLHSHYNEEAEVNGDGRSVSFLFLVAVLIVTIGWVNYTNLATARSLERAREVGVRKVLGALRMDLIRQFLAESLLLNMLALVIAIALAFLLTPSFNRMIGDEAIPSFRLPAAYGLSFLALFSTGAFLSGIYPAFVLSGYHPIAVLKGAFKSTTKGQWLRKGLIVGQFAVSIILIAGTIIVFQQVGYMRDQPLGANINQTLVLDGPVSVGDSLYADSYASFKNDLLQVNGVKNVTASASIMGKEIYMTSGARLATSHNNEWYTFYFMYADYDFIPAFGMQMKAGRYFSKEFGTDNKGVILNEQAVKLFGLQSAQAALRESIIYDNDTLKIMGVVADFHQQGLHVAINPIIFVLKPATHNYYSIKFNTANIRQTTASVEQIWDRHYPSDPFSYFFLDDAFDHQYKADLRFGQVFGLFAFLAIGIACFGLLSLSAYNVIQRTKEIGIRKVLGASVGNIVALLSSEFFFLVLLGILIATPIAWYVMKGWLQGFAYRIPIHWWVFVVAGSLAVLIALLAVSYHAFKAALANPVISLRME
jgi:putative ABC transport system permease protein